MTSFSLSRGQEVEVEIESLSSAGDGVAKYRGIVVFIPYSCPGDRLRVKIQQIKKSFAKAEIIEILKPSRERVEPQCSVFGRCGGCSWQHVSYAEQAAQKKKIISDTLERIAKVEDEIDFKFSPSPKEYRYRNRIQLHYQNQQVGYFAKSSHDLIDIEDCPLAQEELLPGIESLRKRSSKKLQRAELRWFDKELHIASNEKEFGFIQVNEVQNQRMIDRVLEVATKLGSNYFLDLFCGEGNFSLALAERSPDMNIVGTDINSTSIKKAKAKANQKSLEKVSFHCSDSLEFLRTRKNELLSNSLVLLDPPRTGCEEQVLDLLNKSQAPYILYISCNPATWARDLARLQKSGDWELGFLEGLDMFPQTPHVELVSLLKRQNASQTIPS